MFSRSLRLISPSGTTARFSSTALSPAPGGDELGDSAAASGISKCSEPARAAITARSTTFSEFANVSRPIVVLEEAELALGQLQIRPIEPFAGHLEKMCRQYR